MTVLRKYYIKYKYNSKTLGLLIMCYTIFGFCLKEFLGTLSSPDSWPKLSISKAIPSVLIYSVSPNEMPHTLRLKQQKVIFHSSRVWEVQDQGTS